MSGKLMGEVFSLKLSERQQLVLLALADHAKDDGSGARPGNDLLRWKTGLKPRTLERILSELRKTGVIEKVSGGGHRRAVEYKIILSAGEKKLPRGAIGEAETAANIVAGERKPAKRKSAANQVAGEPESILPEKIHSAAKNGNNQPPNFAQSAANQVAIQPLRTLIEPPAPLPAKRRALSLSETEKDEFILRDKTRAREAEKAAAKRIFELWEKTLNFTGKERVFGKGALQAITKKFREGFTEKDLNAAIYGYQIAAPEETENTQKSGNFSAVLRDVEQFRQIYFGNLEKGEK